MFTRYNVSPIALALLVVYVVSFTLYKTGRMKVTTHRKIWNVLLLVTFLTTGLFGLIMAIRRDYALLFSFPVNLLFWHVEAGIVMTVVSLFHLSWHLSYYRDLLKRGREGARARAAEEGSTARRAAKKAATEAVSRTGSVGPEASPQRVGLGNES